MTKLGAIAHLEKALESNPEFREQWKEYIELIVMHELERLPLRMLARAGVAKKISNRVLGLFDAIWWENQIKTKKS